MLLKTQRGKTGFRSINTFKINMSNKTIILVRNVNKRDKCYTICFLNTFFLQKIKF